MFSAYRASVGRSLWPLLSFVALFALLAAPRLPELASRLPAAPNFLDSQLIVWILTWVSHALVTDPTRLFEANINYPAPAQLTCSDHLLSTQLAFVPLHAATGSPILATNLIALLSYPLAAFAMERLARALGCSAAVAWLAGLLFALGPLAVPFNVAVLQFPNLYFPLTALALVRLSERPHLRPAAVLALAFGAGIFTGFYAAVMTALVAVVWTACELLRPVPGRVRFASWAAGAGLAATALLVLVVRPYLERAGVQPLRFAPIFEGWIPAGFARQTFDAVPLAQRVVSLVGIVALLGLASARRAVPPALLLVLLGSVLMRGFPAALDPLISGSPLRAFHWPVRFILVAAFGEALLFAAGLEAIRRYAPARLGVVAVAAAVLVSLPLALRFADVKMLDVPALGPNRPVYDFVAHATAAERGPLLELPLFGRPRADGGGDGTEPDSMLGSTRHWLPLLGAYGGYHPPHRALILGMTSFGDEALAAQTVADLADMTHLRWILLRPASEWRDAEERSRILRVRDLRLAGETEGWTLLEVKREPQHPEWFAALRAGWRPGHTVLGTPLTPLPADATGGDLAAARIPERALAGRLFPLTLRVTNTGRASWPIASAPRLPVVLNQRFAGGPDNFPREHTVGLAGRWRAVDGGDDEVALPELRLGRDLSPGDAYLQPLLLSAPAAPGTYELELRLRQVGDPGFENVPPFRRRLAVVR